VAVCASLSAAMNISRVEDRAGVFLSALFLFLFRVKYGGRGYSLSSAADLP